MFARLAQSVVRHWMLIALGWLGAVALIQSAAPSWQQIINDGDFAYLPADLPSVVGERWMSTAFPWQRGRSQVVVAIARAEEPIGSDDIQVGYDILRRLKNLFGASQMAEAERWATEIAALQQAGHAAALEAAQLRRQVCLEKADEALLDALELDTKLADYWDERVTADPTLAAWQPPRLAVAFHNQALLAQWKGDQAAAEQGFRTAADLDPQLQHAGQTILPADAGRLPLVDIWSWRDDFFGSKLASRDKHVRLIVTQLTNEFMAVDNIQVLGIIERELQPVREPLLHRTRPGLVVAQSGSAAVGADLLRSAAASIKNTELVTIVMVILFLACVYRTPLLVIVPLVTLLVSLLVSTGVVALLTQLAQVPGFQWAELKVFSTTKIFIVVILFGTGTDFCLFLIARYKEELRHQATHAEAVAAALTQVGGALTASAMTTVLGLGMMIFADFGKFHYSGPIIGLCLAITLATCLTLTPALMRGLGRYLFWPFRSEVPAQASGPVAVATDDSEPRGGLAAFWNFLARLVVKRPGTLLVVCVVVMLPWASYGAWSANDVTYDFLSGLPASSPSRIGAEILRRHFPIGEGGPVTVLVRRDQAQFETPAGRDRIRELADALHIPGVSTVRSAEDPLGDYAPGEKPGIASDRGRTLRILRAHPRTKSIFVAQVPELVGSVARFELILEYDPFSLAAIHVLDEVQKRLHRLADAPESFWRGSEFAMTGTTAAIRDLRQVTRRDNVLIQILVVVAVFLVLLVLLRRPVVCIYMMLTVLFSYFVTMGITSFVFQLTYGDSYQGLDWKMPLFLFVILVAVGQDYNVYLATRVFEEQERLGPFAGLHRALVRTGGIITSCGVIMAGTFISMTSAAWPELVPAGWLDILRSLVGPVRSMVETGFALALGVLLDTMVVRPLLVPAFLALLCRWRTGRGRVPIN